MRFYLISFLFIFKLSYVNANESIAFIDLNYILNNSVSGKSINNFVNNIKKKKSEEFKVIENTIKMDEDDLISKKNIIEKSVFNSKVEEIRKRINNYKKERENFNKSLDKNKIKYTNKLLEILNPIISEYVEKNSINIVLPKKMIIIGKKNLDITIPIMTILDKSEQKIDFDE